MVCTNNVYTVTVMVPNASMSDPHQTEGWTADPDGPPSCTAQGILILSLPVRPFRTENTNTHHHLCSGSIVLCPSDPSPASPCATSGSTPRTREVTEINLQLGCDVIGCFPENVGIIFIVILYHLKQSQHLSITCTHVSMDTHSA